MQAREHRVIGIVHGGGGGVGEHRRCGATAVVAPPAGEVPRRRPVARGLHSSTFRLNVSAFCGIGGVSRGCLEGVWEVMGVIRGCLGLFCVRNRSG